MTKPTLKQVLAARQRKKDRKMWAFSVAWFLLSVTVLASMGYSVNESVKIRENAINGYQKGDVIKYWDYPLLNNRRLLAKMEQVGDAKYLGCNVFELMSPNGNVKRIDYVEFRAGVRGGRSSKQTCLLNF